MNILDKFYGFVFSYEDGQLSESESLSKKEVDGIDNEKRNNDNIPLFVKCNECDEYMDFKEGKTDTLDGEWVCPTCRAFVDEKKIYLQLDNENQAFLKENELE